MPEVALLMTNSDLANVADRIQCNMTIETASGESGRTTVPLRAKFMVRQIPSKFCNDGGPNESIAERDYRLRQITAWVVC